MIDFLSLLYLFAPAFLANAAPVLFKNLPGVEHWSTPIHPELLGSHKTYRGFTLGIASAVLLSLLQYALAEQFSLFANITLLQHSPAQSVLIGVLLGAGALTGDAVESFVKRRLKLAPGEALPLWDGIDYIVGAIVFLAPLYVPSFWGAIFLILFAPLISLLANTVAWMIGWKEVWY